MARAKPNKAVVPAAYSPPATRTRSRKATTNTQSQSTEPDNTVEPPKAAPKKRAARQTRTERTEPTTNRIKKPATRGRPASKKASGAATKRTAAAIENNTTTDSSEPVEGPSSQPASQSTPARAKGAPASRRTRAATKAGVASPIASNPNTPKNAGTPRKDMTPLDVVVPDDNNNTTTTDPDDWFPNLPRASTLYTNKSERAQSRRSSLAQSRRSSVSQSRRSSTHQPLEGNEPRNGAVNAEPADEPTADEMTAEAPAEFPGITDDLEAEGSTTEEDEELPEVAEPEHTATSREVDQEEESGNEVDVAPSSDPIIAPSSDPAVEDNDVESEEELTNDEGNDDRDHATEDEDEGMDDAASEDAHIEEFTPEASSPRSPHTPQSASRSEEKEPTTSARKFGLGLLSSVGSAFTRIFRSPLRSPQQPTEPTEHSTITSPAKAAHERKARNKGATPKPRVTDADKRHAMHEAAKAHADRRQQIEREVAKQEPGQKRRRTSVEKIPAHRPGERGYGMVDEYFDELEASENTAPGNQSHHSSPRTPESAKHTAKRRRLGSSTYEDEESDESFTPQPPTTLKRPRNGFRRMMMKQGHEDPMNIFKQDKRALHVNSFRDPQEPLQDDFSKSNRLPTPNKPSPSNVYTGSVAAMPGDVGWKPPNVFKQSQEQLSEKRSRPKTDLDALRRAAEAVARKDEEDRTEEEQRILEEGQRKLGHIAGTGSFSAPEYSSDEDSTMLDDSDEDEEPKTPSKSSGFPSFSLKGAAPKNDSVNGTAPSGKKVTFADTPSVSVIQKPPPPPTPAHAQLPGTAPANPTTPTKAAAPAPAPASTPAQTQPQAQSTTPASAAKTPFGAIGPASLARAREIAEKHKPKTASRLQYSTRMSSSPQNQKSPEDKQSASKAQAAQSKEANDMASSLITQGLVPPVGGTPQPQPAPAGDGQQPVPETHDHLPSWFPASCRNIKDPLDLKQLEQLEEEEDRNIENAWAAWSKNDNQTMFDSFAISMETRKAFGAQLNTESLEEIEQAEREVENEFMRFSAMSTSV
ncbi:uncharacterized protein K452DRAFT_74564 [Aplosporella prunicola CBS 121167]|uniref:Uncharacterized protein n=1 Tax=Aplosporella prunicola CBS 121167 TaxID=1176127 RepID=A0A6A6B5Y6_9PEZI|nr:uncharacterized protein K452DRAFT_74564 [Aplosporella prunicola CBS 121167]KAF2139276.1 hypothetical protein K452DRAFT_74564 [Aplosporella prunicola CBS 121167]